MLFQQSVSYLLPAETLTLFMSEKVLTQSVYGVSVPVILLTPHKHGQSIFGCWQGETARIK
jgi:hypothetical protein